MRVLENKEKEKEHSHEKQYAKMVYQKSKKKKTENRMKKGHDIEEPSSFKLDCPNCYK